jgi:hypothetical protein
MRRHISLVCLASALAVAGCSDTKSNTAASSATPAEKPAVEGNPSLAECFASVNQALTGTWEVTRIFRDDATIAVGAVDSTVAATDQKGVISFQHAFRGGETLHGTWTLTDQGSNDVSFNAANEELERSTGRGILSCDTEPVDGWRLAEVRYEAQSGGATTQTIQHIMVAQDGFVVAISVQSGGSGPYRWAETWTGRRATSSPT